MRNKREDALYPEVADWLARFLQGRHGKAKVSAHDTHKTELSAFLRAEKLHAHFKDSSAYEIQVDVTGVIQTKDVVRLAFVECKTTSITLRDVGQLLGYSLVARPFLSFLISPRGMSDKLRSLLLTFGRQDILVYGKNRSIYLATWVPSRGEIDAATVVPKGSL
jgi:hypothetical protein